MGRKRLGNNKKVDLKLKIEPELLKELNEDGVNKSRLFSISARKYLKKKKKK